MLRDRHGGRADLRLGWFTNEREILQAVAAAATRSGAGVDPPAAAILRRAPPGEFWWFGPANRARMARVRRQSRPRPLTERGRLVLLAGLCILMGGVVLGWLTYPDSPRRNELGLVPQGVAWLFVVACGSILAGQAWGPPPSGRRALGWLSFFVLAVAATAFLVAPETGGWWLWILLGALPAAIRDSSFFRETGTYVLAGLIWAPYFFWLGAGGMHAARLLRAAAGWILSRLRARRPDPSPD